MSNRTGSKAKTVVVFFTVVTTLGLAAVQGPRILNSMLGPRERPQQLQVSIIVVGGGPRTKTVIGTIQESRSVEPVIVHLRDDNFVSTIPAPKLGDQLEVNAVQKEKRPLICEIRDAKTLQRLDRDVVSNGSDVRPGIVKCGWPLRRGLG